MDSRIYNDEIKYREYAIYRKNRRFFIAGLSSLIGGVIIFLIRYFWIYSDSLGTYVAFFGIITAILGLGLLLFRYLQSNNPALYDNRYNPNHDLYLNEINSLRMDISKLKFKSGSKEDSEDLKHSIKKILDSTLTEDIIESKLDTVVTEKIVNGSKERAILEDFENLKYRIESELIRLRKSANLNLVIGTLTTALAIGGLIYEVFGTNLDFSDSVKVLSHYLPRLSLIIFVEIFAFFFLRLYKASLFDIKYFNNEKTNIDFKIISLKVAISNEDKTLLKMTIEELVKTERNFKLGKGESTVELEQLKTEKENNKLLSQILGKLTDKL